MTTHLNLEMACTPEMVKLAIDLQPFMVTLVPEKREEKTTEGGLSVRQHEKEFAQAVETLRSNNILVSMFIAPDFNQIKSSKRVNASHVELHTGYYANAVTESVRVEELDKLTLMSEAADKFGLRVNAGHGLSYRNVQPVAAIPSIEELNIGHAIISRASLCGIQAAVKDMLALLV